MPNFPTPTTNLSASSPNLPTPSSSLPTTPTDNLHATPTCALLPATSSSTSDRRKTSLHLKTSATSVHSTTTKSPKDQSHRHWQTRTSTRSITSHHWKESRRLLQMVPRTVRTAGSFGTSLLLTFAFQVITNPTSRHPTSNRPTTTSHYSWHSGPNSSPHTRNTR